MSPERKKSTAVEAADHCSDVPVQFLAPLKKAQTDFTLLTPFADDAFQSPPQKLHRSLPVSRAWNNTATYSAGCFSKKYSPPWRPPLTTAAVAAGIWMAKVAVVWETPGEGVAAGPQQRR